MVATKALLANLPAQVLNWRPIKKFECKVSRVDSVQDIFVKYIQCQSTFLSTSRVLLYRDILDRVLFYIASLYVTYDSSGTKPNHLFQYVSLIFLMIIMIYKLIFFYTISVENNPFLNT